MGIALRLAGSYVVAFFLAGAVLLVLYEPFYLGRAALSLGTLALLDGLESVLRVGRIDKCSLVGSCSEHSVRTSGIVLWAVIFVGWWGWRASRPPPPGTPDLGLPVDRPSTLLDTLPSGPLSRAGIALGALGVTAVAVAVFTDMVAPFADRSGRAGPAATATRTAIGGPAPRHGLTFAVLRTSPSADATGFACHGIPAPTDHPHNGSCDPYAGDTDCRKRLPIACLDEASGAIGATPPVEGTSLASGVAASERCRAHLGSTWRMARFHDRGGWTVPGSPAGSLPSDVRAWVRIDDQPANCWDPVR